MLLEDALYYWMHRAFHSNQWLYKHVHAYHHRSRQDVSLVNGLQITLAEFALAIVVPGAAPLLVVPMQRRFFLVYSFVGLFGVLADHGLDIFPAFLQPFPLNGVSPSALSLPPVYVFLGGNAGATSHATSQHSTRQLRGPAGALGFHLCHPHRRLSAARPLRDPHTLRGRKPAPCCIFDFMTLVLLSLNLLLCS